MDTVSYLPTHPYLQMTRPDKKSDKLTRTISMGEQPLPELDISL